MKAYVLKGDRLFEARQFRCAGALHDLLIAIEIFKDLLRCTKRLLENIVNTRQPLDGLVEQHQGHHERSKVARSHAGGLALITHVPEQTDDSECAEEFDQRGSDRLL